MKKVMFALCFLLGGIVIVSAQETQDTTSNQYRTEEQSQNPKDQPGQMSGQDQDRERIQSTELPDAVKRSLEGQEYRGWLVNGAFKATGTSDQSSMESDKASTDTQQPGNNAAGAEGEEIFIVELKNGAQTKTVRFDSEGKKLEGEGDGMENQDTPNNQYNQKDQSSPNDPSDPNDSGDQSDDPNNSGNQADPNNQSDQRSPGSQPDATTPDSKTDESNPNK